MLIEFKECANYRGALQAKAEDDKFFWRVNCDVGMEEPWIEIPGALGCALAAHHSINAVERERIYVLHPNRD